MSDKMQALDALQTIINLTSCHTMSRVNDEVIACSEVIEKALNGLPEVDIDSDRRVTCMQAGALEYTILASLAKRWYDVRDQDCAACGACI